MKRGDIGGAQVKLGRADQRHAQCAKSVTERGSLRNRGHRHLPKRHADDGSEDKRNEDQPVVHDAVVQQRSADG